MKITEVKTFSVEPGWLFVKISTDEGITGWGEALGGEAIQQIEEGIATLIRGWSSYLVGKDPCRIEHHWQWMYRSPFWTGGAILNAAISGIEIALWDILGKWLNVPVYTLLGGRCRDRIKIYGNIGGENWKERLEGFNKAGTGVKAVKVAPFSGAVELVDTQKIRVAVERVKEVRRAIGEEMDLLIECHGKVTPSVSIPFIEEIFPYHPFFVEEPSLPENFDALAQITRKARVPIATGERLYTKYHFSEALARCELAVIQPDLCGCGGILEGKKIAAIAEAHHVSVAPHSPYGPLQIAATIQLATCIPNFLIMELGRPESLGKDILKEPIKVRDGYVQITTKPGLGVEVDEEAILKKSYEIKPNTTYLREDGSVAPR